MRQRSQHRRRNRIIMVVVAALVTIATIVSAVIVYSYYSPDRPEPGIVERSAKIPKEKLKTGKVVTIDTSCMFDCPSNGDLKFWVTNVHKTNRTYSATLKMASLYRPHKNSGYETPDDTLDIALGKTKTSKPLRCSITLVALIKMKHTPDRYSKYTEAQGLTLLITPYDDGRPIIHQNADASTIQAIQTSESRVRTAPLGGTLDFGSRKLDAPYNIGEIDGAPSIFLDDFDNNFDDREPLKLGGNQEKDQEYTLTFVGLTDIGDKQGITVMLTPPKHGPIIHESATIVKEQLQRGTVQTGPLGEAMRFGDMEIDLPYVASGEGKWSGIDFDAKIPNDDDAGEITFMPLFVGETQYLREMHYSVTLVALTDLDGQQAATILAIPDSHHPIINKTAKIPLWQRLNGKTISQSFDDGTDGRFGENITIHMPEAFRNIDAEYGIYINAYGNDQSPDIDNDDKMFLKLGETKTSKSLRCKITFAGLKEIDGDQGFTILIAKA